MLNPKKIALIGTGAVGTSFLYSAINQNLAGEYGLIDLFGDLRDGNVLDLEDVVNSMREQYKVRAVDYKDLKDFDYLVITAGRPQKPGETRLNMIGDNVKIIEDIALKVKESGFKGITLIASNPVDIITYAYLKKSGFSPKKVVGSGTILDTARLRFALSSDLKVATSNISAFVIGEHGDSSLVAFSNITVEGVPLANFKSKYTPENYEKDLEYPVSRKAYEIIQRKRATFYGIAAALASLIRAMIYDSHEVLVAGTLLDGQYGYKDVLFGTPCVIGKNGIEKVIELPLNAKEKAKLQKSFEIIDGYNKQFVGK